MSTFLPESAPTVRSWQLAGLEIEENVIPAGTILTPHDHQTAFLSLNLNGGFTERRGERSVEYMAGSATFHPAQHRHRIVVGTSAVRCFNITIPDAWMERLREIAIHPTDAVRDDGGPLVWLSSRLYEELLSPGPWSALAVEGIALEILGVVAKSNGPIADRAEPRWMTVLHQLILAEYQRTLTVTELADRVGVHPVHLSRAWRRFRGCSIADSVHRARVEHACRQIASGNRSLAEIALDSGFADQTHFSRVFKRFTGTTPGAFRSTFSCKQHQVSDDTA